MPGIPENESSTDEIGSAVDAAGLRRGDLDSSPDNIRRLHDLLVEIDSLEQLLRESKSSGLPDSFRPAEQPIPEHPRVDAVGGNPRITTPPCIACRATSARRIYSIEGVAEELVECENCGLGSLFPMPDTARIQSFYPAEYYGAPTAKFEPLVEFGVRLGARVRVQSLVGDLPAGSTVLDVGCGRGVMLRALIELGHEAHGVEIAEEAAAGADDRAEIRIAPELSQAGYPDDFFDAVILWHVLEHLPHPDQSLAEIRRILKPGGRLILAVPNFGSCQSRRAAQAWFHLDLPRHLHHFTPETLERLLRKNAFSTETVRHLALLQNSFGWLQSFLNRVSGTPRNSLYSLLHRGGEHPVVQSLTSKQRRRLRLGYWLGLPVAAIASLIEAAALRGGTIAVTATLGESVKSGDRSMCPDAIATQPALA